MQLKNMISLNGIKSRLETAKKRFHKLKMRLTENTQTSSKIKKK